MRSIYITSRQKVAVTDIRALLNPYIPESTTTAPNSTIIYSLTTALAERKEFQSRHWPGGIPSCIRRYPTRQLTEEEKKIEVSDYPEDELIDEARAWLLFVREQWVSREDAGISEDDEYELRQRRALVVKWASAEQSYRDSFHLRAPPRTSATDYPASAFARIESTSQTFSRYVNIAKIDTPAKRARFIKLLILGYQLDGEISHFNGSDHLPTMVEPNPATYPDASTFGIDDFPLWAFVETADFRSMTMSRCGRALFDTGLWGYKFIDEASLDTGRLAIVDFKSTGTVDVKTVRRPYNMPDVMTYVNGLGFSTWRLKFENSGGREGHENRPMDMDLPILDILETAWENEEFIHSFDGDPDSWSRDIELYAPGYLGMEAEGRADQYDIGNLLDEDTAIELHGKTLDD